MHKLKELYSSPTSELLVIRFEENILSANGYHEGGGGSYDPGDDINDNGEY